ncbi:queuosine biosynthesis protein queC [Candidatus Kinetoplastibacterium blastocrithidii TCC012E]|uniref:7-cyano-7-deazaguanine synthase n=1 Tax=Candidatus Kinetoplastidibacterium blastocrithidiae TCC012E TaxID=1208922 RepID=M1LVE9_9PROT|nr:7-cyano-7-deazaguanine synthase QueC [Candidatus Kinetoplastibacterium blastocrithidii]AFZ83431.1 queuosine biosynthesis protein QueC [Candidatus Kinetoplastibacterium blastocrithidii (ex Strigomonas culicis)]AGF49527.1 queuosine biosynthesis protein queC [Candidatus Kinetoplastibacterium blastocrithidii TCC012E]
MINSIGKKKEKALVLFSGGQDSTTCLFWALNNYKRVDTVGFKYGQRHSVELDCRLSILKIINSRKMAYCNGDLGDDHIIDLGFINQLTENALTSSLDIEYSDGVPNTFVPGRNLLFLTTAAILCYNMNIDAIVGGMSEVDFSGYPDCRDSTIKSQQATISLGLERFISIETPLMWKDKSEIWQMAVDIGGHDLIRIIIEQTHTCYLGHRDHLHDWGYGCGVCPACILRKAGWDTWINVESQ